MNKKKNLGKENQKQCSEAEIFVMNKLRKKGWTLIPTKGSKSPVDIIAYNKKKNLWWGIQVKSTKARMSFNFNSLLDICHALYFVPVLALVK